MTGFGRGTHVSTSFHATVEISSVNRKQAELVFSASREWVGLEARIRPIVLGAISRGRIQVALHVSSTEHTDQLMEVDIAMARGLDDAFLRLSQEFGRLIVPEASDFLRFPGIIRVAEKMADLDQAWMAVELALNEAILDFKASRQAEGEILLDDFCLRLNALESLLEHIERLAKGRVAKQAELLNKRLVELSCPISVEDERVCKELALYADRCDISEEITRLRSHFMKFYEYLRGAHSPGRALDFLCQEIHREFNTVGSKALDAGIAQAVVEAKTELEKIREQVQNIE